MNSQDLEPSEDGPEASREEKALRFVQKFMDKSADFRESYESDWAKAWTEYTNTRNVRASSSQRANLKLPFAYALIEKGVPQLVEAFIGGHPYIEVTGTDDNDKMVSRSLSAQLSRQLDDADIVSNLTEFFKNAAIFGTGICKIPWKTDSVQDEFGLSSIVYDGPEWVNINLNDFFPDWGCSSPGNIEKMRGCVHRVYRSMEDLKRLEKQGENGIYTNLELLEQSLDSRGCNAWMNASTPPDDALSFAMDGSKGHEHGVKTNDKIELWEYWGLFNDENGKPAQHIITIANGDTVIRLQRLNTTSQKKPFFAFPNVPIPGEFYGQSDILAVISLIREGTYLRNARVDLVNQAVNNMWIVDRNSGINVKNLYTRPNGIILADDVNGLKRLDAPPPDAASLRESQNIQFDIQEASGVVDPSQGASNIGNAYGRTAKGVSYLQSWIDARLKLKVRICEELVFKKIGNHMLLLNYDFLPREVWARIYNSESPFTLPSDAFTRNFDFSTSAAMSRLTKAERHSQLQQFVIPFLQVVESAQPLTINWDGLTKRFFEELGWDDASTLVNSPEQRAQMVQERVQGESMSRMEEFKLEIEKEAVLAEIKHSHKMTEETNRAQKRAGNEIVKGIVNHELPKPRRQRGFSNI